MPCVRTPLTRMNKQPTVARLSAVLLARSVLNMVVVGVFKGVLSTGSEKRERDNPNVILMQ